MRRSLRNLVLALAALSLCCGSDWLQFRGTDNRSTSDEKGLPTSFDAATGRNVAWKVPLPGRGPSSPIVVAGRVVVTCASGFHRDRLHVVAVDAPSGKFLWHRQLWATGHTVCHPFGGIASPTPASDGKHVFAFYSSNDLACFDIDGNLKWFRGLAYECPNTRNDVGMASSPLVLGSTVIVQLENQGDSFAIGIDTATGKTRWRIEREHDAIWASPTVLRGKTPKDDLVLLQGRSHLTALNPLTGKLIWQYEIRCHTMASATTCDDVVYLPSFGLNALQYDRATGNVKLLWHERRLRSSRSSPIVHDGRAYAVKSGNILVCADRADGRVLWQLRLKGSLWATPVVADGHLWAANHDGLVQVVELGEKGRLVGSGQIDPAILASPAVAQDALYFRSNTHLWKIAISQ